MMSSAVLGDDLPKLYPIVYEGQSDTATFDNCLELLVMSGYSLAHAMMIMIPEAWEQHADMDENRRAFYEYHAAMRSEEHTSELQSLMRTSNAVFCLKKKK